MLKNHEPRVNRAAVDPRGLNQDGWGEKRGAFLMDYDSDILDASNLLMPLVFFVSPKDLRMPSTIDQIQGISIG